MNVVVNTTIGENRGQERFWMEGTKLAHSFKPGDKYDFIKSVDNKTVDLVQNDNGTETVGVRNRRGKQYPLIELRSDKISDIYDVGMLVRVVIRRGKLTISIHGKEKKQALRVAEFLRKLVNKEALTLGSLCSGGGIIDAAIHQGLNEAGIDCYTKFAVERESKYVESLISNQSSLFRDDSIIVESPIELVEFTGDISVDFIVSSLPCTGASKAGITSNKIKSAEFHKDAGAVFHYWLNFIAKTQPILAAMENVCEYSSTASMAVIRSVLDDMGYELHETTFNGNDFGTLENRDRMTLIAVSKGLSKIKEFSFDFVIPTRQKENRLSDVLDDVPEDHKSWKTYSYLADKEVRDKSSVIKKGFKREMLNGSESKIGTVRRLYHKAGSCDQFVIHPTKPELSRILTPREHAKVKAIPVNMVENQSNTTAHEILGQSVCYPVFQSVGKGIGDYLTSINIEASKALH